MGMMFLDIVKEIKGRDDVMKICIITKQESELSKLFSEGFEDCIFCIPGELPEESVLEGFDAFVLLG